MTINESVFVRKVYEVISNSIGAASRSAFFAMEYPSRPLDASAYSNPWSPSNRDGSMLALENFAWLTDDAPALAAIYQSRGMSLDRLYGQVVTSAGAIVSQPSIVSGNVAERSEDVLFARENIASGNDNFSIRMPSPQLREYNVRRDRLEFARMRLAAQRWQDQQRGDVTSGLSEGLAAAVEAANETLLRTPDRAAVEEAASVWESTDSGSIARIFSTARRDYEESARGSVVLPGYRWHVSFASPTNWYAEDAIDNFIPVTISESEQSSLFLPGRPLRSPRRPVIRIPPGLRPGSRAGETLISIEGLSLPNETPELPEGSGLWNTLNLETGRNETRRIDRTTSKLRVSFKFAKVRIIRPWLNSTLFSLNGWRLPGRRRGDLSTGSSTANDKLFPLIPTDMIVARDVRISAEWGPNDIDRLARFADSLSSRRNEETSLGPFRLSGSYHTSSLFGRSRFRTDGRSIDIPGLQVMGWVCGIVPMSPPHD